jgi:hypothetical protein
VRCIGLVAGVTVLAWAVTALPAWALGGAGPDLTVPAALVCLIPNLVLLGVVEVVKTRGPVVQTGVVLGSFLVRPLVTMGLGLGVYFSIPALDGRPVPLLVWGTVFYLVTLAAESIVVSRQLRGSPAGR